MRKMLFSVVLAVISSVCANAQIETDIYNNSETSAQVSNNYSTPSADEENTWEIYASYKPGKIEDSDFNGVVLGFSRPMQLGSTPLYLSMGINAQYWFASESGVKVNMLSLSFGNLDFSYRLPLSDNITLSPHVGVSARLNVWGKMKSDWFDDMDLFREENRGGAGWKSFVVEWNAGLNLQINKSFYFGVGYGSDFQKMADDEKLHSFSITAGVMF